MTTERAEQRIPQGGQLHFCRTCGKDNDNWSVIAVTGTSVAQYRCPEPNCTGTFCATLRVFAKHSEATDGPGFRQ